MHKVKFVTKNINERDPRYRVITDRVAEFATFRGAVDFIRNLRDRLSDVEVLVGRSELE